MKAPIVMVLAVWLMALNASADELIFVYDTWPPHTYQAATGEATGHDITIVREVCHRLELTPVFRHMPWKRAQVEVKAGRAHGLVGLFWTAARAQFLYDTSEPIGTERNVLFTRTDSGLQVTTLDDLRGKTVSVVRGTSYGPAFDQDSGHIKEWSLDDIMQLRKLAAKRVDLVALAENVGHYLIAHLGLQGQFVILEYPLSAPLPLYVGFSKALGAHGKALADQFDTVVRQLRAEGLLHRVYALSE